MVFGRRSLLYGISRISVESPSGVLYTNPRNAIEQNQIHVPRRRVVQGGFYFHPKDKDLSLGTPDEEKATQRACHSGYSYSGSAVEVSPSAGDILYFG